MTEYYYGNLESYFIEGNHKVSIEQQQQQQKNIQISWF